MRRLSALILLFPLAILLVGSVRISAICAPVSGATCSAVVPGMQAKQTAGACQQKHCCGASACHKDKGGAKGKDGAKGKGAAEDKGCAKDKDGGSCCAECPLCTLVTVNPFFRFEKMNRQESRIEYAVMREDNLSDYVRPHWKPPDFAFLS